MNKVIIVKLGLLLFAAAIIIPFTNRETSYTAAAEYQWTLPSIVETYASDNIFIPKLDGMPRFRKPPFVNWCILLFSKIAGFNLFCVRLPIAIFSIMSILLFYMLLSRLRTDMKDTIAACLILLTFSGYYFYSRIVALEIPMLFFTLGSFYGLSRLFILGEKRGILIAAFFTGMTLLTKSHATFISVLVFIVIWVIKYNEGVVFKKYKKEWALSIILLLVIALSWYLHVFAVYGDAFIKTLKTEMITDRFSFHKYLLFRMLSGGLGLMLPYSLFFLASLYESFKSNDRKNFFFFLFFASIIIPYIFVSSQKDRYMIPALPACAALMAFNLENVNKKYGWIAKVSAAAFIIIPGTLMLLLAIWFGLIGFPLAIISFIILYAVAVMYWKKDMVKAFAVTGLVELVFIGMIYSGLGLWRVPDSTVEMLKSKKIATLERRPFFLDVKLKAPAYTDITWHRGGLDKAVKNNALIYMPRQYMGRFLELMKHHGYSKYKIYYKWKSFNESPQISEVFNAIRKRDINKLIEDTYFIGVIQ